MGNSENGNGVFTVMIVPLQYEYYIRSLKYQTNGDDRESHLYQFCTV